MTEVINRDSSSGAERIVLPEAGEHRRRATAPQQSRVLTNSGWAPTRSPYHQRVMHAQPRSQRQDTSPARAPDAGSTSRP